MSLKLGLRPSILTWVQCSGSGQEMQNVGLGPSRSFCSSVSKRGLWLPGIGSTWELGLASLWEIWKGFLLCPVHCWALGLSHPGSQEEVAPGPLAGHLVDTLVWRRELETTLPFTWKQVQTASATEDRAALKFVVLSGWSTRRRANSRETWAPQENSPLSPWSQQSPPSECL